MVLKLKQIFFKKKFVFGKIKNCQVLILDNGFSNLNLKEICNFETIKDEIFLVNFLFAAIKYLLKFTFVSENFQDTYLKEIVLSSKAKIIIDHEMNGKGFRVKKYFPHKKVFIYQFCDHNFKFKDVLKKVIIANHNLDELKCDYYLSKSKNYDKVLEFIKGKFVEVGSVKNNEIKLKQDEKKEYEIMFISIFRDVEKFHGIYSLNEMMPREANAAIIIKILSEYCLNKNKKITIALSTTREDKQKQKKILTEYMNTKDEKDFFSNYAKNVVYEKMDSYNLASKSKLIVTTGSTLGLELLSRGMKVLFLDIFPQLYEFSAPCPISNYTSEKEGPYWYCGNDKAVITKKIDEILKMNNEDWINIVNQNSLKINYDENNLILKKLVKTVLYDLNH